VSEAFGTAEHRRLHVHKGWEFAAVLALTVAGCAGLPPAESNGAETVAAAPGAAVERTAITPVRVTEAVTVDSDDPAIWLHPDDPSQSLILGTDKGGFLYVFDLQGKIIAEKTVTGLGRMNNIDVEYGLMVDGVATDIAVATERPTSSLRIYRLPEMEPIDGGGVVIFEGQEPQNRPMGVALYKRRSDGAIFAIVSRKEGPSGAYLWQYRLHDDGSGKVVATKVREFGQFSGTGEIEAIAVDDPLGYLYYSDEGAGIRKYHADPDAPEAETELALFGETGFTQDREGISIYQIDDGTGYILVSDQQANEFRIFTREGGPDGPHDHRFLKSVAVSTNESDGSEVTSAALGADFPSGLHIAMSDDKTFHLYAWEDIAGDDLMIAPDGAPSAH
jgi:3-phytase